MRLSPDIEPTFFSRYIAPICLEAKCALLQWRVGSQPVCIAIRRAKRIQEDYEDLGYPLQTSVINLMAVEGITAKVSSECRQNYALRASLD